MYIHTDTRHDKLLSNRYSVASSLLASLALCVGSYPAHPPHTQPNRKVFLSFLYLRYLYCHLQRHLEVHKCTNAKTFHFHVHVDVDKVCVACEVVRIFDQPVPNACPRAARGAGVVWGGIPCVRCGATGPFPCPFPCLSPCAGESNPDPETPHSDRFGPLPAPCAPPKTAPEGVRLIPASVVIKLSPATPPASTRTQKPFTFLCMLMLTWFV